MNSTSIRMKFTFMYVVLMTFLLAACNGCAVKDQFMDASTVDKADMVASQMAFAYIGIHETYLQYYNMATEEQRAVLNKTVNPVLNKTKAAIALLVDTVATWKKTGVESPNYIEILNDAMRLISEATTLINQIRNYGVKTFVENATSTSEAEQLSPVEVK